MESNFPRRNPRDATSACKRSPSYKRNGETLICESWSLTHFSSSSSTAYRLTNGTYTERIHANTAKAPHKMLYRFIYTCAWSNTAGAFLPRVSITWKKKHLQNLDPIVLDRAFFVKSVWHVVIATYWQPHTSTRPTPVLCTNRTVVRGHVVFFILDLWGLHLL